MKRILLTLAAVAALAPWALAVPQAAPQTNQAQIVRFTGGSVQSVTDTTATLTWNTNVKASAIVKYGTSPSQLTQTAEAAWGGPNHTVTLTGLQPNTTYYFQITSSQAEGTGSQAVSDVYHFQTRPGHAGSMMGVPAPTQSAPASSQSTTQSQRANQSGAQAAGGDIDITNGPVIENVSDTGAQIAWSTNVNSSTKVLYGTDPNHLDKVAEMPWGGLTHRVQLRALQPGTTYYYQVYSTEAQGSGQGAIGRVESFTTQGQANASMPQQQQTYSASQGTASDNIKLEAGPVAQDVTDKSARIWWVTDKPAETIVKYGSDVNNLQTAPEKAWGLQDHSVEIGNLQPDTTYYFRVENAKGEVRASGQFKTEAANYAQAGKVRITNGPVIEHIDQNSAIIAWSTNMRSSSIVRYGTDPNNLTQTAEAAWGQGGLNNAHRVHLNNLQPTTTYYFRIESTQAQGTGTQAKADTGQFTTTAPGQAAFNNTQPH